MIPNKNYITSLKLTRHGFSGGGGGGGAAPRNDLHPPKGIWHPRKLHIFWFDSFIFDYSYNQICKITNIMVSDLAMQA